MATIGRKTKRTPEIEDAVIALVVDEGRAEKAACEAVGLAYRTWKDWKRADGSIAERISEGRAKRVRAEAAEALASSSKSQPVVGRLPNWPPTEIDGKREPDWMRKRREGTAGEPTAEEVAEIDAWWKLLKEELARRNGAVGSGAAPST